MDVIFRSDDREAIIYDLKKLTETQLKEILALQKELDLRSASTSPMKPTR
jgi:hypothetical protein